MTRVTTTIIRGCASPALGRSGFHVISRARTALDAGLTAAHETVATASWKQRDYARAIAAFEAMEGFIMARPDLQSGLETAQAWIADYGALAVAATTLAPVPVQMASIAAGLSEMAIWAFLPAIAVGRAIRYGAMGLIIIFFGDEITEWWERQPKAAKQWGTVIFVAGFLALLAWGFVSLFFPNLI